MLQGARIVLASRETAADGALLAACLDECSATFMQATPASWRLLSSEDWSGSPRVAALCGGEALPPELAAGLLGKVGSLWNVYGPTETTVWSSLLQLRPGGTITIGRPIANTEIVLIGRSPEPVPIGVAGELLIGGDGLSRGYLARAALTARRFVPDPVSHLPGRRLYRTGDLARFRSDGEIEYLGRLDYQVKVRGFRIELGEIESNLGRHPSVREAAVLVREDRLGDRRIVGYFTASDKPPAPQDLRDFLKDRLPEYMVPSTFVSVETMPLTPNGKLDRRALPAPDWTPRGGFVAPKGRFEEIVASVWQEVLKVERVGRHDNFFDLGGHSLLLVEARRRLREASGEEVSVLEMLQHPTVDTLAKHLAARGEQGAGTVDLDERDEKLREGRNRLQKRLLRRRSGRSRPSGVPSYQG